jgi:hypothetical protein
MDDENSLLSHENTAWLEKEVLHGLRLWHVMGIVILCFLIIGKKNRGTILYRIILKCKFNSYLQLFSYVAASVSEFQGNKNIHFLISSE